MYPNDLGLSLKICVNVSKCFFFNVMVLNMLCEKDEIVELLKKLDI